MNLGWFWQSVLSMLFLIPSWLAIGFFDRNYQVKPDVFLSWYFFGVSIAPALFGGLPPKTFMPSWEIAGAIFLIGITVGGAANIFLFRAIAAAPNPGLPVAIANVASIGVFLAAIFLSLWAPKYFNAVKIDIWALVGIAMSIIGVAIIAIRR